MISFFDFPEGFLWGTATSAFQIEGGAHAEGKGPSIWDVASEQHPEKFWQEGSPADAADFFHHYREDIAEMRELGLQSFRMSVSWPRVMPAGRGEVNQAGLDFYDRVVDELLANDIKPMVDLYHWDLPQALLETGGFKSPRIVADFRRYAEVCFERLGDRVKLWSTVNEPSVMAYMAYYSGDYPPFETDLGGALSAGHNILLMHFAAVRAYREQGFDGEIGAVNAFTPVYARSLSDEDRLAAERQQDFICNWWLGPMLEGKYPVSVAEHPHIAPFMPDGYRTELADLFTPMDFVGLNYYFPSFVAHKPGTFLDSESVEPYYAQSDYGFVTYPAGLFDSMMYVKERYASPAIYITENGVAHDNEKHDIESMIEDDDRIIYIREHLREVARAIKAGVDIRGYYYWSHFDTYEATSGYKCRFGLNFVDFKTKERRRKKSWDYYRRCIAGNSVD